MFKRPTVKQAAPDVKTIHVDTVLYKGITNNKRVYTRPVYFTFSKKYAEEYAKARLGQYIVKRNLRLLEMTPKTVRWLIKYSTMNQSNKNKLAFIMGVNMTVQNQLNLISKVTQNNSHRKYIYNTMLANLVTSGKSRGNQGGRKSFYNIDLSVHKALCGFCTANGYDGIYAPEMTSPYHPRFGAELALCNPRNAINVNFLLNNN